MKIFINPGHMVGIDSGAVNQTLGVTEAAVVLDISNLVEKYLKQVGYEVMSLQSDNLNGESPSFKNVCATANDWGADAFVSIHCNAFNTEARGTETLCYSVDGEGGRLAKTIHNQLMPTLKTLDSTIPDRGIKEREIIYLILSEYEYKGILFNIVVDLDYEFTEFIVKDESKVDIIRMLVEDTIREI